MDRYRAQIDSSQPVMSASCSGTKVFIHVSDFIIYLPGSIILDRGAPGKIEIRRNIRTATQNGGFRAVAKMKVQTDIDEDF